MFHADTCKITPLMLLFFHSNKLLFFFLCAAGWIWAEFEWTSRYSIAATTADRDAAANACRQATETQIPEAARGEAPGEIETWEKVKGQCNPCIKMLRVRGLTHGQKFVIWMMIPVKNNSNDEFLARVYAN